MDLLRIVEPGGTESTYWVVRAYDGAAPLSFHATKEEAVFAARAEITLSGGGSVEVRDIPDSSTHDRPPPAPADSASSGSASSGSASSGSPLVFVVAALAPAVGISAHQGSAALLRALVCSLAVITWFAVRHVGRPILARWVWRADASPTAAPLGVPEAGLSRRARSAVPRVLACGSGPACGSG